MATNADPESFRDRNLRFHIFSSILEKLRKSIPKIRDLLFGMTINDYFLVAK